MIFTPEDIQQLFQLIDYRIAIVIADVLGKEFLSDQDLKILKENNFDLESELKKVPTYWQAYLFGRLSAILTTSQLQQLNYKDLQKYCTYKQYKQPNQQELAEYRIAASKTYSYIKGMGMRIQQTLSNSISEENIKMFVEERRLKKIEAIDREIKRGVLEKKSIKSIVSNLGNSTNDWNVDWGRIVETEMQDIFQMGKAQVIMEKHGTNARVYKQVMPQACKSCIEAYTTKGIGSQPRIFSLSSLIENGNNIGEKRKDWRPTIGPMHPFCFNSPYIEIDTIEGKKYIKDVKVGDVVYTHLHNYRKVVRVFKRNLPKNFKYGIYDIYYLIEDENFKNGWREDGLHRITGNHKILVNGKMRMVKDVQIGDLLTLKDGSQVKVCEILEIPKSNWGEYLYNFEVEKDHSYFAENVAVSNCRCELHYIPEGYVWDEKTKQFQPPKDYKRKVERKSKVHITVGDKNFEV